MFGKRQRELRKLIDSFRTTSNGELLEDANEFVDHGEWGLAIEFLSDWIYDNDVAVSTLQCQTILRLSKVFGVDSEYHAFMGKMPPYPDLRTPG